MLKLTVQASVQEQASITAYIQNGKYKKGDPRQKKITDMLILLIVKDMLLLSLVESHTFKQSVCTLDQRFTKAFDDYTTHREVESNR